MERHFDFQAALFEFSRLFAYDEPNDRVIAVIGGAFLDTSLEHILRSFLPESEEVKKLLEPNGLLGSYGSRLKMTYCLGLIDKIIKDDLILIGKIRNKFAHDLFISFEDKNIASWCRELKWHKACFLGYVPSDATNRDLFQVGVNTLISHLHGNISIARGEKREIKDEYRDVR